MISRVMAVEPQLGNREKSEECFGSFVKVKSLGSWRGACIVKAGGERLCPFRLEGGGGEISTDVKRQDLYFGFYVYVGSGIRVGRWRGRCSGLSLDEHK